MEIVYASDDGFCQHVAVSMFALLDHNETEDICLHILSNGIHEENKEKLRGIAEGFGRELHFYEMDAYAEQLRQRVPGLDTGQFHIATLSRLFMGTVLPEQVERVLYLDADTVVLRALHKLFALDLQGEVMAAVAEPTIYPQVKEQLHIAADAPYYNAGVLLLDLKRWREEGLEAQCIAYYAEQGGRLPFNDQDVLNAVLKGRILTLPQKYNFFSNYYYFHYKTLLELAPWYAACETEAEYRRARKHPALVHFAGAERPWIAGSLNHYRRAYQLYLNATPWAGAERVSGRRLYMLAYHLMNLLTWTLPKTRKWISERYYEACISDSEL